MPGQGLGNANERVSIGVTGKTGHAPPNMAAAHYRTLEKAAPLIAVIALWLLAHGYAGTVSDARLYVVQSLRVLSPEIYDHDLFFAFGSQDDFSLFSRLFAPLIAALGIGTASKLLLGAAHVLWFSGMAALACRFAGSYRKAMLLLALVVVLPREFGGSQVFAYGEPFVTPRVLAEALSLWALFAFLHGRAAATAFLLLAAIVLHPLVGGFALGVIYVFYLLPGGGRGLWGAWALGAVAVLGAAILTLAGIAPFDRVSQTMDPEWLSIVQARNRYVFPTLWDTHAWARLALDTAIMLSAAAILDGWRRRILLAVTAAFAAGMVVTVIGGDLLHNVFVIQIQFFRSAKLLHILTGLAMGLVLLALWRQRTNAGPISAFIALSWVVADAIAPTLGACLGTAAAGLAVHQVRRKPAAYGQPLSVGLIASAVIAGTGIFCLRLWISKDPFVAFVPTGQLMASDFIRFTWTDIVVFACLAFLVLRRPPHVVRRLTPALALILIVAAITVWDRRGPWLTGVEGQFDATALQARIPERATVYWEGDVRGAWLLLRRASYVSSAQGAGVLFARRTAIAYRNRAEALAGVTGRELLDVYGRKRKALAAPRPIDRKTIVTACRNAVGLDFMVLSRAVDGAYSAHWVAPAPFHDKVALAGGVELKPVRNFYLYDCGRIRAAAGS